MKHKAVVVLSHLLEGGRSFKVKFKGEEAPRTLVLSEDYELCQLATRENGEEVLLPVLGVDMGPFVKICEQLDDVEVFTIGCATAMMNMRKPRLESQPAPVEELS